MMAAEAWPAAGKEESGLLDCLADGDDIIRRGVVRQDPRPKDESGMPTADVQDLASPGLHLAGRAREDQAGIEIGPNEDGRAAETVDEPGEVGPEIAEDVVRAGRKDGVQQDGRIAADDVGD
jgi:hypothetical protein